MGVWVTLMDLFDCVNQGNIDRAVEVLSSMLRRYLA